MAKELTVRPPDLYSGSESSLDVASSFVKQCHDGHDGCSRDETLLPSRIIDVGEGGNSIKLIEPVQGQQGIYASLSYCASIARLIFAFPLMTLRLAGIRAD